MLDEAGTLWASQAKALFLQARNAGARVLVLAMPRNTRALAAAPCCAGWPKNHDALDMRESRRAREGWLHDVGRDLRADMSQGDSTCYGKRVQCASRTHDAARSGCLGPGRREPGKALCLSQAATTTCG